MSTERIALHILAHNPMARAERLEHNSALNIQAYRAGCLACARNISLEHGEHAKRRVLTRGLKFEYGSRERSKIVYSRLRTHIRMAQKDLHELIRLYVPRQLARSILPLDMSLDPVRCIEDGFLMLKRRPQLSKTRFEFEACRAVLLGFYYFDIHEARGRTASDTALRRIIQFFVRKGVFEMPPTPRRITSYHDPVRSYRCVGVSEFGDRKTHGATALRTRGYVARVRSSRGTLPVLFFARKKSTLSIVRRMLIGGQWNPERILDRYAVRVCYRDQQDLLLGYEQFFGPLPGVYKTKNRLTQGKNSPSNRHSDDQFRDLKYVVQIRGLLVEIQHMTGRTCFDIAYSRTPMNHSLYNARQMREINPPGLLQCMFPEYVYGIDWSSSKIREAIAAHIFAQLPHES